MPPILLLWVLSLESNGLDVFVQINDVTVYSKTTGVESSYSEKLNPLLLSGDNDVKVCLALPPSSASSRTKARTPSPSPQHTSEGPAFFLKIQKGERGRDPGQEGILLRFEWDSKQMPLTSGELKTVFDGKFQVPILPFPPPTWSEIPPLQVDRPALEAFVRDYAEALRKRNVERLVGLNTPKFQELARSLGLETAVMTLGFQDFLGSMMSAKDWSVSVAPSLAFSLEGKSHLIRITSGNGTSPIWVRSGGREIPFDLTVSFIGGTWCILR